MVSSEKAFLSLNICHLSISAYKTQMLECRSEASDWPHLRDSRMLCDWSPQVRPLLHAPLNIPLCHVCMCGSVSEADFTGDMCLNISARHIHLCLQSIVSESRLNGDTHFSTSWPALFVSACAKHTFRNWFHWWLWVGNRWSSRLHLVSEKDDCWRKDAYECRWLHSGASTKHFTCSRTPSDSDFIQEPILGTCT